jgi:hypothetical protein
VLAAPVASTVLAVPVVLAVSVEVLVAIQVKTTALVHMPLRRPLILPTPHPGNLHCKVTQTFELFNLFNTTHPKLKTHFIHSTPLIRSIRSILSSSLLDLGPISI